MEAQEIFNRVATHLFKQGKQARGFVQSRYRMTLDGKSLMCAVGCLIPDEIYNTDMEGKTIIGLVENPSKFPGLPEWFGPNLDLIDRLQEAHDNVYSWQNADALRSALRNVAARHALDTEVLLDLELSP